MYTIRVIFRYFGLFEWLDGWIDAFQNLLAANVVLAPLLLLFIEECGLPLPVPGDVILAYTGYRLSATPNSPPIWGAFLAAQIAALAGATVLFFLSRRWGQMLVVKLGKFIFLKEKHIRKAEQAFARWGVLAIIVGRHIPGLRIPVTIFAATSGVHYRTFIVSTFISTSVWILAYLTLGRRIGATFHTEIQHYVGTSVGVIVGVILLFVAIHLIGLWREAHGKDPEL